MTSSIELKVIQIGKNEGYYRKNCERCSYIFEHEPYYKWRLQPDNSNKYLRGMFWTIHCKPCLEKTRDEWREALENLQV